MGKIYEVKSEFSPEQKDGYNLLLKATIGDLFDSVRGIGPDLFVVRHFTEQSISEICKGVIALRDDSDLYELQRRQRLLIEKVDNAFENARAFITRPTSVYQSYDDEKAVIIVSCKDGYFGCGWYNSSGSGKKGLMLAALLLYAFGFLNAGIDKVLWKATYMCLPYEVNIGDPKAVDRLIIDSMKNEIIKQNNENIHIKCKI